MYKEIFSKRETEKTDCYQYIIRLISFSDKRGGDKNKVDNSKNIIVLNKRDE